MTMQARDTGPLKAVSPTPLYYPLPPLEVWTRQVVALPLAPLADTRAHTRAAHPHAAAPRTRIG